MTGLADRRRVPPAPPADRTWYRKRAVRWVLLDALGGLDPQFPEPEDLEGVVAR